MISFGFIGLKGFKGNADKSGEKAATDRKSTQKLGFKGGARTQKEEIFLIISGVLGEKFESGDDARRLLYGTNRQHYGRRVYDSEMLDRIRSRITDGLKTGKIRSIKKKAWLSQGTREVRTYSGTRLHDPVEEYANKIMHYWLRHDARLNGSSVSKFPMHRYQALKKDDPRLRALNGVLHNEPQSLNTDLVCSHIQVRVLELILKAYGFDPDVLPLSVRKDFDFDQIKKSG